MEAEKRPDVRMSECSVNSSPQSSGAEGRKPRQRDWTQNRFMVEPWIHGALHVACFAAWIFARWAAGIRCLQRFVTQKVEGKLVSVHVTWKQ